jgi:hypothetical protein
MSNPPSIATWMLKHLTLGKKNEALAGDLLEEFRRGRTATWYWRQVLMVIVLGFAGDLRSQWLAIFYAALCAIPVPAYWLFVDRVMDNPFFTSRWHLEWPYSTIVDQILFWGPQLLYIWFALIIYFLFFSLATRTVNLHRLTQSLWKSVFVFMTVYAGLLAFFVLLPGHPGHPIDRRHITALSAIMDPQFLEFRLPFLLTLFLSIRMTLPGIDERSTTVEAPVR